MHVLRFFIVRDGVLRLDDLHGDVAVFNIRVRYDLHIVVLNLLEGHNLVVIRHVLIKKLMDEIFA